MDAFGFDHRANILHAWRFDGESGRLLLCAQQAVLRQIKLWFLDHRLDWRPVAFADLGGETEWTVCLSLGRMPEDLPPFLDALRRILVLRDLKSSIASGVALDFYTIPEDGVPSDAWTRTEVGELINTFKYSGSGPLAKEQAVGLLAARMAAILELTPSFRGSSAILTVPGHDSREASWSEKLASEVARAAGLRVVRTRARSQVRPPAKGGPVDLAGEFSVDPGELANASVIVVDDVMHTGNSVTYVALAARAAGATGVHVLIGARTIR